MTASTLSPQPTTHMEALRIADLGLEPGVVRDLAMKFLFYRGRMTRSELADELRLSANVVEELLQSLSQDELASVLGGTTGGPNGYVYMLTQKGLDRAEQAIQRSGYVGPAPVSLRAYIAQMESQSVRNEAITREQIARALAPLVLSERTMTRVGRAAASRKPTLVYGKSGNGKTTVVRSLASVVGGTIRIPFAIEIGGHIVHLFDPSKHVLAEDDEERAIEGTLLKSRADKRWVTIHRPIIWAGGELTRHSLELVYDEQTKVYEAPLQLKANGGTLIIDDFGRQQMPAVQLLNRWIVPLEGGNDHLTMHTGQTIEVPFDVLVLFSTNLSPHDLADEAFLRRIRYKIEVPNPTEDEFRAIFRRECDMRSIAASEDAVSHLLTRWYAPHGRELRGCHPRDIVEAIVDAAMYDSQHPELTPEVIDEVCATYFLEPGLAPD